MTDPPSGYRDLVKDSATSFFDLFESDQTTTDAMDPDGSSGDSSSDVGTCVLLPVSGSLELLSFSFDAVCLRMDSLLAATQARLASLAIDLRTEVGSEEVPRHLIVLQCPMALEDPVTNDEDPAITLADLTEKVIGNLFDLARAASIFEEITGDYPLATRVSMFSGLGVTSDVEDEPKICTEVLYNMQCLHWINQLAENDLLT